MGKRERHCLAFSRLQLHLGEPFEFLFRPLQARLLVMDVELHDFFARSLSCVGHIH